MFTSRQKKEVVDSDEDQAFIEMVLNLGGHTVYLAVSRYRISLVRA